MIDAFSKDGDLERCCEVFDLMVKRGKGVNSYGFSGMLYACGVAGKPVLALEFYKRAKEAGEVPRDPDMYGVWCTSVLHAFLKTQRSVQR